MASETLGNRPNGSVLLLLLLLLAVMAVVEEDVVGDDGSFSTAAVVDDEEEVDLGALGVDGRCVGNDALIEYGWVGGVVFFALGGVAGQAGGAAGVGRRGGVGGHSTRRRGGGLGHRRGRGRVGGRARLVGAVIGRGRATREQGQAERDEAG